MGNLASVAKALKYLNYDSVITSDPNVISSREKLLGIVWGSDYPGDVRTVDVHVRRLREKIEDDPSKPGRIRTRRSAGYYFEPKI